MQNLQATYSKKYFSVKFTAAEQNTVNRNHSPKIYLAILGALCVKAVALPVSHAQAIIKSANTNRSRTTVSPTETFSPASNIGPAYTKE